MSIQIWSDVDVDVQSVAAAAKPITAISKANPAVATVEDHDLIAGEVVLLRVKGLGELDYAVARVGPVTADTLVLLGIDTTDFSGAFVSGSVSKITFGFSAETITDVTPSGGEAAKVAITTIHRKPDFNAIGKETPLSYALGSLWDIEDPALIAFKAASRAKKVTAVRFGFPDGTQILFASLPSTKLAPGGAAGAAVTTPVSLEVRGLLTAYPGA